MNSSTVVRARDGITRPKWREFFSSDMITTEHVVRQADPAWSGERTNRRFGFWGRVRGAAKSVEAPGGPLGQRFAPEAPPRARIGFVGRGKRGRARRKPDCPAPQAAPFEPPLDSFPQTPFYEGTGLGRAPESRAVIP